jgi:phosphohistidine phosphatase
MKTLYLLRHAKSSWDDEALDDFDRPLDARGAEAAPRMAANMKEEGWIPDTILCSAARRARETMELVTPKLGVDGAPRIERELYMAEPDAMLERLRALPDSANSVLMIGHNPGHELLAKMLAGDGKKKALKRLRKKYPTGALAVLTFPAERWAEVAEGSGYLQAFVRPKDV